jgi:hypothetical protein
MSIAKNLVEVLNQYKEKEAVFDNEVRELRNQISQLTKEIKQKFMQFEGDLLGRLCTDDFYFTMDWGVEEDGTEKDYASIAVGYKDDRTMPPCRISVPLEKVDEIKTFEDLKQYSDTYFHPSFWESPSLNERAMQEESERNLRNAYLSMHDYDFEHGDVEA